MGNCHWSSKSWRKEPASFRKRVAGTNKLDKKDVHLSTYSSCDDYDAYALYDVSPTYLDLPSPPASSHASLQRDDWLLRYQESTHRMLDGRKSASYCEASPAAEATPSLDLVEAETYASVGDALRATSRQLTTSQPFSVDVDIKTPITLSSSSLEVDHVLRQYVYEPLKTREDDQSPSWENESYVHNPGNFTINPIPRQLTKQVAKLTDTTAESILRELTEDRSFIEDSREFVDIAMDATATYRWKFMNVEISEAAEDEPRYIRLAYSNNPRDLPSLPDSFLQLLYDGVIHCLPHNQAFSQPIRLSFMLPDSVDLRQITVMYSNTDVGGTTRWTILGKPECSRAGISWHNHQFSLHQNKAVLLADRRQLQLILRYFCIFAILVDGREEQAQNVAVDAFLKIAVNSFRYTVNLKVVVGCNIDTCNERKEMAVSNGYKYVEKTEYIMLENAGDLTVKVENIRWMDDHVLHPLSFTQDKHGLWRGNARPNLFEVTSKDAVRDGVDSSFSSDVVIQQSDRTPLVFRISQDLHELPMTTATPTAGVLPHCKCHCCRAGPAGTAVMWQRDTSTEGDHRKPPSTRRIPPAELLATQCQPGSGEDSRRLSPMQPLRSDDSSSGASLCCENDNDYARAATFDDPHHAHSGIDDAAAAARPTIKTFDEWQAPDPDRHQVSLTPYGQLQ